MIHNLKTAWPTKISASFLRGCFAIYFKMHALFFEKKGIDHITHANFKLGVQYSLREYYTPNLKFIIWIYKKMKT